jgi:hypothetical protein
VPEGVRSGGEVGQGSASARPLKGATDGTDALVEGVPPSSVLLLWATLTGAFALGVGSSLTLAGLGTRSGYFVMLAVAGVAAR